MSSDNQSEYFLKIALLGDGAVGKTSLRNRFMGRGFNTSHLMTIGADFASYVKPIDGKNVTYQIWDLAGQQTFKNVRARFYRGALGGLMLFDITRKSSFMNVTSWIEEIWRNSGRGPGVPIILLGNKSDLRDKDSVSNKMGIQYAEALSRKTIKKGFKVHYMETSAKTGLNVNEAFETIGRQIIELLKSGRLSLDKK